MVDEDNMKIKKRRRK